MSSFVAKVTYPDGSEKRVKNLGWLLRHKDGVERFGVFQNHKKGISAILQAIVWVNRQRLVYESDFADPSILMTFLTRPSWYGVDVLWVIPWKIDRGTYTIGKRWSMKQLGF